VIAGFGLAAKDKLSNAGAFGQPEDQIRAPFERLLSDLAQLLNFPKSAVVAVGESSIADLKTRPDYAITVHNALVGFIELKAPGKGADPRKFKDLHDKAQWDKLHSLPNLIYTDGNAFSLWQNGQRLLVGGGYIENVEPAVWNYEVSGKQVLLQWFSYRRPIATGRLLGTGASHPHWGHPARSLARRIHHGTHKRAQCSGDARRP
jgi:Type ISP C-terminal specificity domain